MSSAGVVTSPSSGGTTNLTVTHKSTGISKTFRISSGTVREGIYYIENRGTGRYMDVEGPSYSSNARIQQWSLHGRDQQKWRISIHTNGDYIIQSIYSEMYLRVEISSYSSGANIIQYENSDWTSTRWKIEQTDNGSYKIIPMLIQSFVISVPLTAYSDGTDLVQVAYTNDTNYRDEWFLKTDIYSAMVNNYYDLGYSVWFDESESQSISNINSYISAVSDRYHELFGLDLNYNNATYFASMSDLCRVTVDPANVVQICPHLEHYRWVDVNRNFISNHPGNELITSAFWTCHRVDCRDSYNRSCSSGYAIYMLGLFTATDRDLYSKGTLLHELNHQYGASDHYHEEASVGYDGVCENWPYCSQCGSEPRSSSCVMYSSSMNIEVVDIICDDCKEEIITHLIDHHVMED